MSENADIVRRLDHIGEKPSSLEAAIREIATGLRTLFKIMDPNQHPSNQYVLDHLTICAAQARQFRWYTA